MHRAHERVMRIRPAPADENTLCMRENRTNLVFYREIGLNEGVWRFWHGN